MTTEGIGAVLAIPSGRVVSRPFALRQGLLRRSLSPLASPQLSVRFANPYKMP